MDFKCKVSELTIINSKDESILVDTVVTQFVSEEAKTIYGSEYINKKMTLEFKENYTIHNKFFNVGESYRIILDDLILDEFGKIVNRETSTEDNMKLIKKVKNVVSGDSRCNYNVTLQFSGWTPIKKGETRIGVDGITITNGELKVNNNANKPNANKVSVKVDFGDVIEMEDDNFCIPVLVNGKKFKDLLFKKCSDGTIEELDKKEIACKTRLIYASGTTLVRVNDILTVTIKDDAVRIEYQDGKIRKIRYNTLEEAIEILKLIHSQLNN